MTIRGMDVSNWQGEIDWDAVAGAVAESGQDFAICKASEGIEYRDPLFRRNWAETRRVGMLRGAYHFARPSQNEPEPEADFFLEMLAAAGGLEPGDVLVLDMEDTDAAGDLSDWTLRWLRRVYEATGARPVLYSGRWYMEPHGLTGVPPLGDYGLWLAAHGLDEAPEPPEPWLVLALWQYSSTGTVPGVAGPCDLDVFFGTDGQFRAYGVPVAWPRPQVPGPLREDNSAALRVQVWPIIADLERDLAALKRVLESG